MASKNDQNFIAFCDDFISNRQTGKRREATIRSVAFGKIQQLDKNNRL